MRITESDRNDILLKYKQLNESGPVANMGVGTPVQVSKINDIGNSAPQKARTSSAWMAGKSNSPSTPSTLPENEEEPCGEEAVDMAKGQLLNTADKSLDLFKLLQNDGAQLEPWVASKILLASDYISTVWEYMAYNKPNQEGEQKEPSIEVVEVEKETERFP